MPDWSRRVDGRFPVLADPGFLAATKYGVAFQCRIHTNTSNTPATFLVAEDGQLRWAHVGQGPKNYSDRPSIADMLARIKELRADP